MKIAIGNDHTAFLLKELIVGYLTDKNLSYSNLSDKNLSDSNLPDNNLSTRNLPSSNIDVMDMGSYDNQRVDYSDYAQKVCEKVVSGECDFGILICGSGGGMSMAANKIRGVRAILCSEPYTAKMARSHNNANVLCIGTRVVGEDLAKMIVDAFLTEPFEGGRHSARVAKVMDLENLPNSRG